MKRHFLSLIAASSLLAGFRLHAAAAAPGLDIQIQAVNATAVTLRVSGLSGQIYAVQRSPDLVAWQEVHRAAIPAASTFYDYTDTARPPGKAYYRAVLPAEYTAVPGEVLVRYRQRPDEVAASFLAASSGLAGATDIIFSSAMQNAGESPVIVYRTTLPVEDAVESLRQNENVETAEPNLIYRWLEIPNDPRFTDGSQWGSGNDFPGTRAAAAWAEGVTGEGAVVGVLDSDFDINHPDLAGNIFTNPVEAAGQPNVDDDGNGYVDDIHGWDFVNNDNSVFDNGTPGQNLAHSHGTQVGGVIAAAGNNGVGGAGAAWRAKIIPLKIGDYRGASTRAAFDAMDYLTDLKIRHQLNLPAANCSWGAYSPSILLRDACIRMANARIMTVCAAGNDGGDNDVAPLYPASIDTATVPDYAPDSGTTPYDSIIAVASINHLGGLSDFSNYGAVSVDLAAPGGSRFGQGIFTTHPGGGFVSASGTSFSAPYVTATLALLASRHPQLSVFDLRGALLVRAMPNSALSGKVDTGGQLDAYATALGVVGPVNRSPVCAAEVVLVEGDHINIPVLANDSDPDGDVLSVVSYTQPQTGVVGPSPQGADWVRYTPVPRTTEKQYFQYTVSDGRGGTATGNVFVSFPAVANRAPLAVNDNAQTEAATTVLIAATENDTDPDGDALRITSIGTVQNGMAVLNGSSTIVYQSSPGFAGTEAISYTISDGRGGTATAQVFIQVGSTPGPQTAPWLYAPADGATGFPIASRALPVLVVRLFGFSAVPGATSYEAIFTPDGGSPFTVTSSGDGELIPSGQTLASFTWYSWKVRGRNGPAAGPWSPLSRFQTEQNNAVQITPANNAADIDPLGLRLTWTPAPSAAGKYDFEVYEGTTLRAGYSITYSDGAWSSTEATINLEYGKTYRWRVRGRISPPDSPWSSYWTFSTRAASPTAQISPANGAANVPLNTTLRWTADPRASGYDFRLFRGTTLVAGYGATYTGHAWPATSASVVLEYGRTYNWEVRARILENGNAWSPSWTFSTPPPPPLTAPTNVTAARVAGSWTSARITWTNNAGLGATFIIRQSRNGAPYSFGENVPANTSAATRTGLDSNAAYTFTVEAVVGGTSSAPSAASPVVSLIPALAAVESPADGATGVSPAGTNLLHWTDVPEAASYDWELYAADGTTLLRSGSSSLSYEADINPSLSQDLAWSTTYRWRVRARVLTSNNNVWGTLWSFTTAAAPVIAAPSNVNAMRVAGSYTSATISWSNNAPGVTAFKIWERRDGGTLTFGETVPANATSATRGGLTANSSYVFYVQAIVGASDSALTASPAVSLTPALAAPTAPAHGAPGVTRTNPLLDWTIVDGTTTYDWELYAANGTTLITSGNTAVSNDHVGRNLSANTTYRWRVRARVFANNNPWSPLYSFTTGP